jgi:hypothetical protein
MQWSHSEADSGSTSQQVPRLLQNSVRLLLFSQKHGTDVYPKPYASILYNHNQFETWVFNIMLLSTYRFIKQV